MSTVKSKKLQVGTDATSTNNFTIYQPASPDGTLRIGVGNADSPTEVAQFNANGYKPQQPVAFSALFSTDQSFSINSWTKIQYNTEDFDTNSNYDNSTNYRFTPTVAGYYQVNANIRINFSGSAGDGTYLALYKNGSAWNVTSRINVTSLWGSLSLSSLVYLNGSTDYIEMYGFTNHSSPFFDHNGSVPSRLSAILISQG